MVQILMLSLFLTFSMAVQAGSPAEAATKQTKPQTKNKSNDKAACYRAANKVKGRRHKDAAIQACG